jgi:hypothetical protein
MKQLIEKLQSRNLIFKRLTLIDIRGEFQSRKKAKLYLGVNLNRYYACIIDINKKSPILQKEAVELMGFHKKLEKYNSSAVKRKYIYIHKTPLCSKAHTLFKNQGWVILMD